MSYFYLNGPKWKTLEPCGAIRGQLKAWVFDYSKGKRVKVDRIAAARSIANSRTEVKTDVEKVSLLQKM